MKDYGLDNTKSVFYVLTIYSWISHCTCSAYRKPVAKTTGLVNQEIGNWPL